MIKIALSGGIGSGKTTVASVFIKLGVSVFNADYEAKLLYKNEEILTAIKNLFGSGVFINNDQADLKKIAKLVFNDRTKLNQLNEIIHPELYKNYTNWCFKKQAETYTIIESAIIFESGFYRNVDQIIWVDAPEIIRIQRVIERDLIKKDAVLARIRNQINHLSSNRKIDFTINNSGEKLLIPQIINIHNSLLTSI